MQRIAWHKAQGHKVVVVSGGLEAYLEPWCDSHGVELICSSLQQSDGILTGRYEGRQCVLTEKARLVRERYDRATYPTIYAYGDTPEDWICWPLLLSSTISGKRLASQVGANKSFKPTPLRARLNSGVRHHEGSGDHRNFEPTIRGAKRH